MRNDDFHAGIFPVWRRGLYIAVTDPIYPRMSRFDDTRAAILALLRTLEAKVSAPVSLYDIGVPLVEAGFTEDEIVNALFQMQEDKEVELIAGNRLRITHDIV